MLLTNWYGTFQFIPLCCLIFLTEISKCCCNRYLFQKGGLTINLKSIWQIMLKIYYKQQNRCLNFSTPLFTKFQLCTIWIKKKPQAKIILKPKIYVTKCFDMFVGRYCFRKCFVIYFVLLKVYLRALKTRFTVLLFLKLMEKRLWHFLCLKALISLFLKGFCLTKYLSLWNIRCVQNILISTISLHKNMHK